MKESIQVLNHTAADFVRKSLHCLRLKLSMKKYILVKTDSAVIFAREFLPVCLIFKYIIESIQVKNHSVVIFAKKPLELMASKSNTKGHMLKKNDDHVLICIVYS